MNNINFINEKIKATKRSIEHWKEQLKNFPNEEVFARCLNTRKIELQAFQEVKTQLEAWEEVQGRIVEGEDGDGHYCYIETTYFTGEKGEKVKKGLYNDETR